MADPLPHRPVWMFDYVVDSGLALILVPWAGLWPPRTGRQHRLSAMLVVQVVLFGALGVVLLLLPDPSS